MALLNADALIRELKAFVGAEWKKLVLGVLKTSLRNLPGALKNVSTQDIIRCCITCSLAPWMQKGGSDDTFLKIKLGAAAFSVLGKRLGELPRCRSAGNSNARRLE